MITKPFYLLIACNILNIYNEATATLTPKSPRGNKENKSKVDKVRLGPQNYTVFDKNFVTEAATAKDILANCQAFFRETDEYRFDGIVLGYVTPVSVCTMKVKMVNKNDNFSGIIMAMILQKYLEINLHILALYGFR